MFQNISKTTQKFQADETVEKKVSAQLVQVYNNEIEKHQRQSYPKKIKVLNGVYSEFQKTFSEKPIRDKLKTRLANKDIWEEINPRLGNVKKYLLVLASGNPSLEKHVNKFHFIKFSTEELYLLFAELTRKKFFKLSVALGGFGKVDHQLLVKN